MRKVSTEKPEASATVTPIYTQKGPACWCDAPALVVQVLSSIFRSLEPRKGAAEGEKEGREDLRLKYGASFEGMRRSCM